MTPLVSICIPTYNGEKYLEETLHSIELQTYKNIEVIISDDQSKDSTLTICEKFKREKNIPVHIYSHQPGGIGANWNYCIERSNGEYIKFLFQDDVMEPDCIAVMLDYLQKNNVQIVVSKRKIIDQNSDEVTTGKWFEDYGDLQIPAGLYYEDFYKFTKHSFKALDFNRYIIHNIIGEPIVSLFSRKIFKKVGKFDESLIQILDYIFYLKVLKKYSIGMINKKLVSFRIHNEQTSAANQKNNVEEYKYIGKFFIFNFRKNIDVQHFKFLVYHYYPFVKKNRFILQIFKRIYK